MDPDRGMGGKLRQRVEKNGDRLADLHLWRLGPGHLGAVLSILTNDPARDQSFYRERLARFRSLSHLTIEVVHES
jgi:Co/Zn/Cd efflux system component